LNKVLYLAEWDMQTYMPPRADSGRSSQIRYLTELVVTLWLEPHFKHSIEELSQTKLSHQDEAMIRNFTQMGKLYFNVPKELLIERASLTSKSVMVWQESRKKQDFSMFKPYLKKIIDSHISIADHLGYIEHRYDPLLDLYEPGLTVKTVTRVLHTLKEPFTLLHMKLSEKTRSLRFKKSTFTKDHQIKISNYIMKTMRYDLTAGRLDESAHPFCTTVDTKDVRITTTYHLDDMRNSLASVMHETGHALYEQGLPLQYEFTPLGQAASYGIHESQSRLWENQIGRSPQFLRFLSTYLKQVFPGYFSRMPFDTYVKFFNEVKSTPIRIDSDEVAYNLHILLRFELEKGIISGISNFFLN